MGNCRQQAVAGHTVDASLGSMVQQLGRAEWYSPREEPTSAWTGGIRFLLAWGRQCGSTDQIGSWNQAASSSRGKSRLNQNNYYIRTLLVMLASTQPSIIGVGTGTFLLPTPLPSIGLPRSRTQILFLTSRPHLQGQGQRQAKVQGLMVECDHYQTRICILYSKSSAINTWKAYHYGKWIQSIFHGYYLGQGHTPRSQPSKPRPRTATKVTIFKAKDSHQGHNLQGQGQPSRSQPSRPRTAIKVTTFKAKA